MSTVDSGRLDDLARALGEHSRTSVAHDAHCRAVEQAETLAGQVRACFESLERAQEQLKEVGVEASVKLPVPLNEAWAEWRAVKMAKAVIEKER